MIVDSLSKKKEGVVLGVFNKPGNIIFFFTQTHTGDENNPLNYRSNSITAVWR